MYSPSQVEIQIEPYRGWNGCTLVRVRKPSRIQIEPYRGWNTIQRIRYFNPSTDSNRTVSGLKHFTPLHHNAVYHSNRTVSGLKPSLVALASAAFSIQIEPYRGWNLSASFGSTTPWFKSNRIGVETSFKTSKLAYIAIFKSNRIGVETRRRTRDIPTHSPFKSNRIGVETYFPFGVPDSGIIQIEPYRGWNLFQSTRMLCKIHSNRTVSGLKQAPPLPHACGAKIQIEPYRGWNCLAARLTMCRGRIQIEPYRGWNSTSCVLSLFFMAFKSNRIGVETHTHKYHQDRSQWNSNRTVSGLKLPAFVRNRPGFDIQIEPYRGWNENAFKQSRTFIDSNRTVSGLKHLTSYEAHTRIHSNRTVSGLKHGNVIIKKNLNTNSNRTVSGLKRTCSRIVSWTLKIQIEPYRGWNWYMLINSIIVIEFKSNRIGVETSLYGP